jgi:hypothetical protein
VTGKKSGREIERSGVISGGADSKEFFNLVASAVPPLGFMEFFERSGVIWALPTRKDFVEPRASGGTAVVEVACRYRIADPLPLRCRCTTTD